MAKAPLVTPRRRRRPRRSWRSVVLRLFLAAVLGVGVLLLGPLLAYRFVDPPATPLMVLRSFQGHGIDYRYRPLEELAVSLPRAVVAAEDNNFCLHHGVDWGAVETVVEEWRRSGRLRGASTLTMQLVKNLVLWPRSEALPALDGVRKLLEVPLALGMDAFYSKRRIMELYLNVVEFGPGIYGAAAAADGWFGRSPAVLSFAQSAALARQLPAPLARRPDDPNAAGRVATLRRRVAQLDRWRLSCWH
ncbi:MAG: transglycosylase domain-containing protein [Candidatus Competibacterales bacterium]